MSSNSILLSIVIPTKNRQKYCIEVIKHILSLNLKNTELVIQDNSDLPLLKDYIEKINDSRIVYNYSAGTISFVDNFSIAIELTNGKYVCMIGDDDTVLPNITEVVKYAYENKIEAILPRLVSYFWPSDRPIKEIYRNGCLTTTKFKTPKYLSLEVEENLIKLVDNGFQDYQSLNIPRIYHGIVRKDILDKIKDKTGSYFSGLTPDMYMSVCLACTVTNLYTYNNPITVSGICPTSGSSDSATGKHTGELKDAPHFRGHKSYNWIEKIPYIYTVETIWAESGMQALKDMNRQDLYERFDARRFIVKLSIMYPQFRDRLLLLGNQYGLTKRNYIFEKIKYNTGKYKNRLVQISKKILHNEVSQKIPCIENIKEATEIVYESLKK